MLGKLVVATCLIASTVIIHAGGLTLVMSRVLHSTRQRDTQIWPLMWLVIRVVWWLIALHLIEIAVWALFFWWQQCFSDIESAFYFSGVTYATIGYGDLVLPKEWRLFGPLEGLAGILMCGLSTGFFFAIVFRMYVMRTNRGDS